MRSLTALEAQFLQQLKEVVQSGQEDGAPVRGVYVTEARTSGPALQLGLKVQGQSALVYFTVLIYGTRPVRYHLQSAPDPSAEECRSLWNKMLGPLNLVTEKSGLRAGRYHLFYEVEYPEKRLKELGER